MEYIVFYISSHGFGHLTRCLAIIEELLEQTSVGIYLVSGEKQNEFAKEYLYSYSNKVKFHIQNTDVGLINRENSLEVDKVLLEKNLNDFIGNWEILAKEDIAILNKIKIKAVISDISSLGIIVAKKLGVKLLKISNFTWLHQYEYLDIDEVIRNNFKDSYLGIDLFIEYDLSLDNSFIGSAKERTGFICRKINSTRVNEIKEKYGKILFVSSGKSANLPEIEIENFDGTIIYTEGIEIKTKSSKYKLPVSVLDSHNYMAAADIALVKAGWGSIAEGLIGHTALILMERDGVLEDSFMINELKQRKLAISIKSEELKKIDFEYWKDKVENEIDLDSLKKIENKTVELVQIILKNI